MSGRHSVFPFIGIHARDYLEVIDIGYRERY